MTSVCDWGTDHVVLQSNYCRVPCVKTGGVHFTINGNPYFLLVLVSNVIIVESKISKSYSTNMFQTYWPKPRKSEAVVFYNTKHLAFFSSFSNATRMRILLSKIKIGTSQGQVFSKPFKLLKNKLRLSLMTNFFVHRKNTSEGYSHLFCHHHLQKSSCLSHCAHLLR